VGRIGGAIAVEPPPGFAEPYAMTLPTRALLCAALLAAALPSSSAAQEPTPQPAAPSAPAPVRMPGTRVHGAVFDSTIMRPLANATVQLASRADIARGPSYSAVTDASGFYRIDSVPPGDYLITFFSPRLDQLGLSGPMHAVKVNLGVQRVEVDLGLPGARRVIAMHCGPKPASDSSGLLMGEVRRADRPEPLAGANVNAQWFELTIGSAGMVRSTPTKRVRTGNDGRFAICGIPWDARISLFAVAGRASTGSVNMEVPPFSVVTRDLLVDVADTLRLSDTSSVRRGTARLSGIVRSPSGSPLPGARVSLRGTTTESTADAQGAYSLSGLPAGTQTLEARAIGYIPIGVSVDLYSNRAVTHDVRFDESARVLETVNVTAQQVYSRAEQEFLDAKKRGFGHFLDREQIERRNPFRTSDLLRAVPGVNIYQGNSPGGTATITMRGVSSLSGTCQPAIVVDGMRFLGDAGDIDVLSNPDDIQGMAIYRGPAETPVEFQGLNTCGAIVIWTRRGAPPARRGREE
jgi:hypothetical protein